MVPLPDPVDNLEKGGRGTEFPEGPPSNDTENEITAAYGAWGKAG